MAGLNFTRAHLLDTLSDIAGFRAGLALTHSQIAERLPEFDKLLHGELDDGVRVRSEVFDKLVQQLLYVLGAASSPEPASVMELYAKYFPDRKKLDVYNAIGDMVFQRTAARMRANDRSPVDLSWLEDAARDKFGTLGEEIAKDWYALAYRAANESAWNRTIRYVNWRDKIELEALFQDAGLDTAHGTFLDQRFIDYLSRNFHDIDVMHWRKFEALTAEYFAREGAHVELGPGTNDDGVDARIWWPDDDPAKPAAILVQCKRQKAKVPKVTLKALYADVVHENATSGLIVTTQELSPGAEQVRVARGYPIEQANRTTLQQWVARMRSPYVGLFGA